MGGECSDVVQTQIVYLLLSYSAYISQVSICDFHEFDAICENISTKILTLHTFACFYSVFRKFLK